MFMPVLGHFVCRLLREGKSLKIRTTAARRGWLRFVLRHRRFNVKRHSSKWQVGLADGPTNWRPSEGGKA